MYERVSNGIVIAAVALLAGFAFAMVLKSRPSATPPPCDVELRYVNNG